MKEFSVIRTIHPNGAAVQQKLLSALTVCALLLRPGAAKAACRIRFALMAGFALLVAGQANAAFSLGGGGTYGVIAFGGSGNFQLTNDTQISGNVGVGLGTNSVQLAGADISGQLLIAGNGVSVSFGNGTVSGGVTQGVPGVTTAISDLTSLSSTLGAEAGTSLAITNGGSLNLATNPGTIDAQGNHVFTTTYSNGASGFTIHGAASDYVVFNIGANGVTLKGPITLDGIASDHVLFNFLGTSGELKGSANKSIVEGVFLAPNLKVNMDAVTIDGRLFGGSNNDFQIVSNFALNAPPSQIVAPVPEPTTLAIWGLGALGCAIAGYRRRQLA